MASYNSKVTGNEIKQCTQNENEKQRYWGVLAF